MSRPDRISDEAVASISVRGPCPAVFLAMRLSLAVAWAAPRLSILMGAGRREPHDKHPTIRRGGRPAQYFVRAWRARSRARMQV